MNDSIRPRGTVEVPCATCDTPEMYCSRCPPLPGDGGQTYFFVDALDPRLPDGPFICPGCAAGMITHYGCGRALLVEGVSRAKCECPPGCTHEVPMTETGSN